MKITKTSDPQVKPSIIMIVYGNGGVGKTTFASTAPKPLLVDCENGAKYFGLRGIKMDVAKITDANDILGIGEVARSGEYKTIILDPIGELMEKMKISMILKADKRYVAGGAPTMAGWGWLKDQMRNLIKVLRDSGCNVLFVAHVSEVDDEGRVLKRPMLMTKLSDEIINMVDVVGYMEVVKVDDEEKRIIRVDSASDKYIAKDRTGQLGKIIPPNFTDIIDACQGNKVFKWSASKAVSTPEQQEAVATPSAVKKTSVKDKIAKAKKGEKVEEVVEDDGSDDNAEVE